jgi:APA family basic amino acid/polyamine antiporter
MPDVSTPPAPENAGGFQQKLGLFDATMLVAGSMVGSGIFIVAADMARDVGSSGWLILLWVVAGVMTILGALSYAELAAMMPRAGGQYVFLREAYGPLSGFLYGWTCFLVIQTGFIAAVAVAFAKFLGVLVPSLGTDQILWRTDALNVDLKLSIPWMDEPMSFFKRTGFGISTGQLVATGLIVFLTALNSRGIESGRWVQNIFTVAKMLGLGLLIVLGLTLAAHPEAIQLNRANLWDGITDTARYAEAYRIAPFTSVAVLLVLCGAMVGPLFSSDAWNNITFIAGEVKNPQRTLPWGLMLGTVLVIVLYVLANLAYLAALPLHGTKDSQPIPNVAETDPTFLRGIDHAKDDRVGTAVLERVSPGFGVTLMAIVVMISTFGCVNGLVIMGPRLYYAMAKDGLFFQSVGKLNQNGVPGAGLVLQAAWAIVLLFTGSYSELLDYIIFAALLFYIVTVSAVFVLRRKRPDLPRPYRVPGYPVLPALYVLLCAVMALALLVAKPVYSWPSFLIVLSGIPVFFFWRATLSSGK